MSTKMSPMAPCPPCTLVSYVPWRRVKKTRNPPWLPESPRWRCSERPSGIVRRLIDVGGLTPSKEKKEKKTLFFSVGFFSEGISAFADRCKSSNETKRNETNNVLDEADDA